MFLEGAMLMPGAGPKPPPPPPLSWRSYGRFGRPAGQGQAKNHLEEGC